MSSYLKGDPPSCALLFSRKGVSRAPLFFSDRFWILERSFMKRPKLGRCFCLRAADITSLQIFWWSIGDNLSRNTGLASLKVPHLFKPGYCDRFGYYTQIFVRFIALIGLLCLVSWIIQTAHVVKGINSALQSLELQGQQILNSMGPWTESFNTRKPKSNIYFDGKSAFIGHSLVYDCSELQSFFSFGSNLTTLCPLTYAIGRFRFV